MLAAMQFMWDHHRADVDVNGIGGDWPTVTITRPANDAVFPDGAEVIIEAAASDKDGSVVLVEFLASDTLKIGEVTAAPCTITWRNIKSGVYTLKAVATDNQGHKRTSTGVAIKVGAPQVVRLEAENAVRSGTPTIFRDATASNGACLRMQQTGTITWQLSGVPAGSYEIVFGSRLPFDTPKHQYINVNGMRVAEIIFDGSLNVWLEKKLTVNLVQGNNVIQMELFWGWMDLDYLGVPSSIVTSVDGPSELPVGFSLQQNYPNLFWSGATSRSAGNPVTTIRYSLAKPERIKLIVYDIHGRQVHIVVDAQQDTGLHQISFDGRNLASGVYFYRLEAGAFVDEKRMLILK